MNTTPNIIVGQRVLATLDNWFYAPDGKQYKAVYGTVGAVRDSSETLGVRTNARSTNWYVEIGRMTIAGCQIHYVIQCDDVHLGTVVEQHVSAEKGAIEYVRPCAIYPAD